MDLIALSKPQLNEVLKRVSGRGRDMARNNKQDYLDALYMRRDIPWEEYSEQSKGLLSLYEEALEDNDWDR